MMKDKILGKVLLMPDGSQPSFHAVSDFEDMQPRSGPFAQLRVHTAELVRQGAQNGDSLVPGNDLNTQQIQTALTAQLGWVQRAQSFVDIGTSRGSPWTVKAQNVETMADNRLDEAIQGLGLSPQAQAEAMTLRTQAIIGDPANVAPSTRPRVKGLQV